MNKKEEIYWAIKEINENLQVNQGGFIKLGSLEVEFRKLGFWGVSDVKYCGKSINDVKKIEIVLDAEDSESFKILVNHIENEDIHIENYMKVLDNEQK